MFDPRQCATSAIPAGVEIVSRKTYMRETRGRRVAQLELNFNDDKDVWSGTVEGTKWIGVSVFHLSVAVTPHVMRTGKGQAPATGRVLATPTERNLGRDWFLSGTLELGRTPEAGKQRRSSSPGHGVRTKLVSRNSQLNLESQVHAVTNSTAVSRMIAPRPTPTLLFDLSRCQRGGPLF